VRVAAHPSGEEERARERQGVDSRASNLGPNLKKEEGKKERKQKQPLEKKNPQPAQNFFSFSFSFVTEKET